MRFKLLVNMFVYLSEFQHCFLRENDSCSPPRLATVSALHQSCSRPQKSCSGGGSGCSFDFGRRFRTMTWIPADISDLRTAFRLRRVPSGGFQDTGRCESIAKGTARARGGGGKAGACWRSEGCFGSEAGGSAGPPIALVFGRRRFSSSGCCCCCPRSCCTECWLLREAFVPDGSFFVRN